MFSSGNHESENDFSYLNYVRRTANQNALGLASGSDRPTRYFSWDMPLVHFIAIGAAACS